MLPASLAADIRQQVLHYLSATFHFRDRNVEQALSRFLNDPDRGIFKGPWLQLRRPFRPAAADAANFFEVRPPFHPFRHQHRAWERLRSGGGHRPESTLVTTGTGSGKTECFLYPVLDLCLRERRAGRSGIKAIVLYPMNALANDQAGRFAEQILRDNVYREAGVTVGLYVGQGDGGPAPEKHSVMEWLLDERGERIGAAAITDHEAMQRRPPDILLTNYKMLDYLLLRPSDARLWQHNDADTLRYLVLDELHTYDGAQGADVGCLIRRLKERLQIPKGRLCMVGTSATIAGDDAGASLRHFAGKLFEEDFGLWADSVIEEDRLRVEEIVIEGQDDGLSELPAGHFCEAWEEETADDYAFRQAVLWGAPSYQSVDTPDAVGNQRVNWSRQLGRWIRGRVLFRHLLESASDRLLSWEEAMEAIAQRDLRFFRLPKQDRHRVLSSFLALVAQARETRSGRDYPLVPMQVQLWIREVRRLGRVVSSEPEFAWLDEPPQDKAVLPAFQCADCGESGWLAITDPDRDGAIHSKGVAGEALKSEPRAIYEGFFKRGGRSPHIRVIAPSAPVAPGEQMISSEEQENLGTSSQQLTLRRGRGPCPLTGAKTFAVRVSRETAQREGTNQVVGRQRCPCCGGEENVFIIGSQAATISSVAIDEMFGSLLNQDPKLLAFTDSVQDASHRAGFFTARTYHFTFRTALQHLIDSRHHRGLPLPDAGEELLAIAMSDGNIWPGSVRDAVATLAPPDVREHSDYAPFMRSAPGTEPPAKFLKQFMARLAWEATSEFGMQVSIGRTLESNGASALLWDEAKVAGTVRALRGRLNMVDPRLMQLTEETLRKWVFGLLHRHRERGALSHPYIQEYASLDGRAWGKYDWQKRVTGEREAHPLPGARKPRLIATAPDRTHDYILALSASGKSWHLQWTRRVLSVAGVEDTSLRDLLAEFLRAGAHAGLLVLLADSPEKKIYGIKWEAATLISGGEKFVCSETGHTVVRPAMEAPYWDDMPSLAYSARTGVYRREAFVEREHYYQQRYRRGAIRRVYAMEHTGLLTNAEREDIERRFGDRRTADDPNIITCTSTLEMGIDIGDLSATMLCSVPPTTANYQQRIGRAGRSTGTALVVSVINQRPHDLFFFARPDQMLQGKVQPPGCWLDAAAVLVRQYLAFCFDTATQRGVLRRLPATAAQLNAEIESGEGPIPALIEFISLQQEALQTSFLARFGGDVVQPDTRARFRRDAALEVLRSRLATTAREFDLQRRELQNASRRLRDRRQTLHKEDDADEIREIDRELKLLAGRLGRLNRTLALELLADHGLLPNYAFPERGVRFYGAIYNQRGDAPQREEPKEYEAIRSASVALRELAPSNHFYTRSRVFDIQSIALGSPTDPLIEDWAICGACGHMRRREDLLKPDALPACPQCGEAQGAAAQIDSGQQRKLLHFARSEAISYMEAYASLSGDKSDDRDPQIYRLADSFDFTADGEAGAMGEDRLPFGIEYRATATLRQINGGYFEEPADVLAGEGQKLPREGFRVCRDCGCVAEPFSQLANVHHRRSCRAYRAAERQKQRNQPVDAFNWEHVYLYRELKSEVIRLLLPDVTDEDLTTLIACVQLGLRLKFQGEPANLRAIGRAIPDARTGILRNFLVLMDAVPGGTGFLKTLYQSEDIQGRKGEGLMDVLRLALQQLEDCVCRRFTGAAMTDGCYRCIRHYHLQHRSNQISRERGIALLQRLIAAGESRAEIQALDAISPKSLAESRLERKFVDRLKEVVTTKAGHWEETIVRGAKAYRLSLGGSSSRVWDMELQPELGPRHGVNIACQPDFLLTSDEANVLPIAVFTDGFDPHVHPTEADSRLPDDFQKRRAIVASGRYHMWAVTWKDLDEQARPAFCLKPQVVRIMQGAADRKTEAGGRRIDAGQLTGNGFVQLLAFLEHPAAADWADLVRKAAITALAAIAGARPNRVSDDQLATAVSCWAVDRSAFSSNREDGKGWVISPDLSNSGDLLVALAFEGAVPTANVPTLEAVLGDSRLERVQDSYCERWRRFLSIVNLFQFASGFTFRTSSECTGAESRVAPVAQQPLPAGWSGVLEQTAVFARPIVEAIARLTPHLPIVEYYHDDLPEEVFAELAWPEKRVVLLVGDQCSFSSRWQSIGWVVFTDNQLTASGYGAIISALD